MRSLELITPPATEPVDVTLFVEHSRLDDVTAETATVDAYIAAARQWAEGFLGKQLITATYELYLDNFPPAARPIEIPRPPLQSIESIIYTDEDGNPQTLAANLYDVDDKGDNPGRVQPIEDETWPDTARVFNAVTIQFIAGYGLTGTDVPDVFNQAILMHAAHFYEHRESASDDKTIRKIPFAIESLLMPRRIWRVA